MTDGISVALYLGASVLFILSLGGLSHQSTAVRGNLYGVLGMAVALLVAFAAWMGVARPTPPLDPKSARALLDLEFPDHRPDAVWIAANGAGIIARDGALALVLYRRGDGYVARDLPWSAIAALKPTGGRLTLRLSDARPVFAVEDDAWPPKELA